MRKLRIEEITIKVPFVDSYSIPMEIARVFNNKLADLVESKSMFYLEPIEEVCILEDYRYEESHAMLCHIFTLTVTIVDKEQSDRVLKGVSIPSMNFITIPSKGGKEH